jgi:acyl carrier protein
MTQTTRPSTAEIQAWLVAYIARELAVDPAHIDVQAPLAEQGLGSRQAILMAGDLEDWLGREIPDTLVWDFPTIHGVAVFLGGEAA